MLSTQDIPERPEWQTVVLLSYATAAIVLDYHHTFMPRETWDSLLLYLLIPLALLLLFRRSPADYGFRLGKWRRGLVITFGGWLLVVPFLWLASREPSFQRYYAAIWARAGFGGTLRWAAEDLFGWEFFFRGFWLFTLAEIAGPWAIFLQAIPFTFGHLGKPELETLSCILGGSLFGWVAWETESFFYPFLIHLFVTVFAVWASTL